MAALFLTACGNEDEQINDAPVAVKVSADIEETQARASETTWDPNDEIGISCTGDKTHYTNVRYYLNGSNIFSSDNSICFQDPTTTATFSAYYPYEENEGTITKTIKDDTPLKDIDFLYATGPTASKSSPEVNFIRVDDTKDYRFKHCMSRLSFEFIAGTGITDLQGLTSFTISGLKMEGTFDTTTGTATVTATAATDLTVDVSGSTAKESSSVIVFPQNVASFELSLVLGGITYSASLTVLDGELSAGKNYNYTVTISKTEIIVDEPMIDGWKTVDADSGTAEMD